MKVAIKNSSDFKEQKNYLNFKKLHSTKFRQKIKKDKNIREYKISEIIHHLREWISLNSITFTIR